MFQFFADLFSTEGVIQTLLLLCLISIIGLSLGRIKIKGLSFGGAFVFFVAIAAGHFAAKAGIRTNAHMMELAKSVGIMIFVFTIGLQAGPGFVASLKKGGIKLTLSSLTGIVLQTILVVVIFKIFNLNARETTGMYAGAVTNTPMLIAAQEAAAGSGDADLIGAAYAAIYPFSVILVMMCILATTKMFPKSKAKALEKTGDEDNVLLEYRITDESLDGKTVRDVVAESGLHFVISRIWRDGDVSIPLYNTVINKDDHILVICNISVREALDGYFGKEEATDWNRPDIDWDVVDNNMVARTIMVTNKSVIGHTLGQLKLRNKFGVNITRITRSDFTIVPSADTELLFGDVLTVVGGETKIKTLAKAVGNEESSLDEPRLIPLLLGILLGIILGCIPFTIPGLSAPIKLGLAGGAIIIGLLLGAAGPALHIHIYTTRSVNLMLGQLGITTFFAAVGFSVGGSFVETVFSARGLSWIAMSTAVIIIPIIIVAILNEKVFKIDYARNVGVICGMCTNPNALSFTRNLLHSDTPSEAYATVYPFVTFIRIFLAQLLILVLS